MKNTITMFMVLALMSISVSAFAGKKKTAKKGKATHSRKYEAKKKALKKKAPKATQKAVETVEE